MEAEHQTLFTVSHSDHEQKSEPMEIENSAGPPQNKVAEIPPEVLLSLQSDRILERKTQQIKRRKEYDVGRWISFDLFPRESGICFRSHSRILAEEKSGGRK